MVIIPSHKPQQVRESLVESKMFPQFSMKITPIILLGYLTVPCEFGVKITKKIKPKFPQISYLNSFLRSLECKRPSKSQKCKFFKFIWDLWSLIR